VPELELEELLLEELLDELDELLLDELLLDELLELVELLELAVTPELEELELIGTTPPELELLELDELLELEELLELGELPELDELELLLPEFTSSGCLTVIFTVSDTLSPAAFVRVSWYTISTVSPTFTAGAVNQKLPLLGSLR
jgi:hypothetical protein